MPISSSAEAALSHLRRVKPLGGWDVESKGGAVRLLRRKIPLTDSYFLDVHHDPSSDCIVGILSKPRNGKAQGQVIVDREGRPSPATKTEIITVTTYDPSKTSASSTTSSTARGSATTTRSSTRTTTTNTTTPTPTLTPEENKQLLQYAMYAFAFAIFLKALTQAMMTVSLLFVPLVYFYALQTCPSVDSFDAKKELRRILRGHHLPDNHPDKPKNFFDRTLARVSAAVTTELATGLGYEVDMMSLGGAAWLTIVKVPTSTMEFFWIGAFGKWTYVYSRRVEA